MLLSVVTLTPGVTCVLLISTLKVPPAFPILSTFIFLNGLGGFAREITEVDASRNIILLFTCSVLLIRGLVQDLQSLCLDGIECLYAPAP